MKTLQRGIDATCHTTCDEARRARPERPVGLSPVHARNNRDETLVRNVVPLRLSGLSSESHQFIHSTNRRQIAPAPCIHSRPALRNESPFSYRHSPHPTCKHTTLSLTLLGPPQRRPWQRRIRSDHSKWATICYSAVRQIDN